jgi:pimeloyl-ACP methyl ester carboxylesterase
MSLVQAGGHTLEYETIPGEPVIVFLHEGLGSVAMWKDFPRRLAEKTRCGALIYSRYGYGNSDRLTAPFGPYFMHNEALETLPDLLSQLQIERPILFGHSDGGSIALMYAGTHPARGAIVLAPHVFIEQEAIDSIRSTERNYNSGGLRAKLARYHQDPDATFRGWSEIWLRPAFRAWNIEEFLPKIGCPILAMQGVEDEYGTMEHLARIARQSPRVELKKIPDCRHSPHFDQADAVIEAAARFIAAL